MLNSLIRNIGKKGGGDKERGSFYSKNGPKLIFEKHLAYKCYVSKPGAASY